MTDPDPNNNSNTDTNTVIPLADLVVTKAVSNATPSVGDTVTFTVTVSNQGPNAATGVTLQDSLPAGLTFVSATPSQGTYNGATGVWTVGTVATTAPSTLTWIVCWLPGRWAARKLRLYMPAARLTAWLIELLCCKKAT